MGEQRLTDVTKSPAARVATVVGLGSAVIALVMTVAMVIVALGGYSTEVLQLCLLIWVLSLTTVFIVTRYLKRIAAANDAAASDAATQDAAPQDVEPGTSSGQ